MYEEHSTHKVHCIPYNEQHQCVRPTDVDKRDFLSVGHKVEGDRQVLALMDHHVRLRLVPRDGRMRHKRTHLNTGLDTPSHDSITAHGTGGFSL